MIETAVHILQLMSCIWLALSVILPVVNRNITNAAHRNSPVAYDKTTKPVTQPANLMQPAQVTLGLTAVDILLSLF